MDLYGEIILDHYRNPHHCGKLEQPSCSARDSNPLCGDMLEFELRLDREGHIADVGFTAKGCAISQASASMLTDELLGKTLEEVKNITNEDMFRMLGVPLTSARVKCALLSLVTVKKALTLHQLQHS